MYFYISQLTSTKINIELTIKLNLIKLKLNTTYKDNFTTIFCNFNFNVKVSNRVDKVRIRAYFGQKTNSKVL